MYLGQSAGMRLHDAQAHSRGGMYGARMYGSGAAQMYGSGAGGGHHHKGLLPGEHLVSEKDMVDAVQAYKGLHNLGHGGHMLHLPHLHPHHIIASHLAEGGPRGGFAFLPLLAGAAVPLISEAIKGLVGAFGKVGGERLANNVMGSGFHAGLPMPVHLHSGRHYRIHGEGFMDFLRTMMGHAKNLFRSQPARKIGAHALNALKEAAMHAITDRLEKLSHAADTKVKQLDPDIETEADRMPPKYSEEDPNPMPALPTYDESEAPDPQHDDQDQEIAGSGYRRRGAAPRYRRAPPPRKTPTKRRAPARTRGGGPAKRSHNLIHHMPHIF